MDTPLSYRKGNREVKFTVQGHTTDNWWRS